MNLWRILNEKFLYCLICFCLSSGLANGWGFYAHKKINRMAIFTLPPEMIRFYKHHLLFIMEEAVGPDKRRYVVAEEAPRHYIDLEAFGDSALYKLPRYWKEAVAAYSEDTLKAYGIVPWHIQKEANRLTAAFIRRDVKAILKISADIGHYIADAHVPLHTTVNYNGQLTNQHGIHGLWESRLPELFSDNYDFFVGKAHYQDNIQMSAWSAIIGAHQALDAVFLFEQQLTEKFLTGKKYGYEERGATTVKVYSYAFSEAYHKLLEGQVEEQMRRAIKMIGDIWYTCWINAGQPDLYYLLGETVVSEATLDALELEYDENRSIKGD